jgi:hypothetical protein
VDQKRIADDLEFIKMISMIRCLQNNKKKASLVCAWDFEVPENVIDVPWPSESESSAFLDSEFTRLQNSPLKKLLE